MAFPVPKDALRRIKAALLLIGLFASSMPRGLGYAEAYVSPKDLDDRSDAIVVGHIKGNTFPRVADDPSEDYSATLVISEVLKGDLKPGERPIVIHPDLKPVVMDWSQIKGAVILCGGGMHGPVSDDIRADRLWFLRKGNPKDEKGNETLGIWKGQDTAPVELKPYYLAFLTDNPEEVLKKYIQGDSELAKLSRDYVNAKEIERIAQIADLNERVDKLLPYYLNGQDPRGQARKQIILTGPVGIEKLVPLYKQSTDEMYQIGIITTLTEMGYRDADPLLATMLEKEDQFWARQYVRANTWWTAEEPDPSSDQARNVSKARMDAILAALRGTNDPHAIEVINLVNKRWQNWQGYILSDPDPYP